MTVLSPDDRRLAKWTRLQPISVDPAKRDAYVSKHVSGGRTAVENVKAGKAEYSVMKPSDGK